MISRGFEASMKSSRRLSIFLILFSSLIARAQWHSLGNVTAFEKLPGGLELAAQSARVRVMVLSPNIIRLRYAPTGSFSPDHSFAVLPDAFANAPAIEIKDAADAVTLATVELRVRIQKSPLRISFFDSQGRVISEDDARYPVSFDGDSFRVYKSMPVDEHYFGLGDKTGTLDRRDFAYTDWNFDMFGFQESTDPIYKSIPFFLGLRKGAAYGFFLDNTYRSHFDFGKEFRDAYSFGAEGGELNYYFFYGPDPKRVVSDFSALVGRTPLPPLFALGFQQCRYSYYPESQVREIAAEFRKRKIPVDVLYLDIDYQEKNRPFTIDRERFPHFEQMVKDLKQEGIKLIAITDLHIAALPNAGYKPYDEGIAHDYFVHNPDGSVYVGPVWPGPSVFPDFTRSAVRDWWGTLYTEFTKMGIRGFWNDMNEPAVFVLPQKTMPLDTVHYVEDRKTDHREIHNVFGMENVHATHDALLKLQPNLRPFVLTRAAYAGTARYAATWTGDNTASWDHMRLSVAQLNNLGLSAYPLVGDDIGGFNGSATPELLTRWTELGVFNPFFRAHAAKETRNREPWVDGPEHEAIRKRYIETRYRLLPYIYTGMEETSRTGIPLMRPMFLEFPDDPKLATNASEFMFGSRLLVAARLWPFVGPYEVILPQGDWADYWTGGGIHGGQTIKIDPPMDTLPVYVRAGTILPEQPVVQNTDETPKGPLELKVFPGPNCSGSLYQDDGNTFAYQKGEYLRQTFTCEAGSRALKIHLAAPEGTYRPWFQDLKFTVYCKGTPTTTIVTLDGKLIKTWKSTANAITIESIPWTPAAHDLEIRY